MMSTNKNTDKNLSLDFDAVPTDPPAIELTPDTPPPPPSVPAAATPPDDPNGAITLADYAERERPGIA
jgi:hypothetical protein